MKENIADKKSHQRSKFLYSPALALYLGFFFSFLQNNFPLIETLLDLGADGSVGKTKTNGSQVLHLQAEKADDIDLSELYPDATVVSIVCTMMQVRDLHFGAYNI